MNKIIAAAVIIFMLHSCADSATSENTPDSLQQSSVNDETSATHNNHHSMTNKMMEDMKAVKMTGDVDLDFATMMIPHHQGAVEMSEDYLSKGQDETIRAMAEKIVSVQKKEIEELKALVANHKPNANASHGDHDAKKHEMMEGMMMMMDQMNAVKMTNNPDKDSVAMMIPHHQSAIYMAKVVLAKGKNADIKKFAEKVIVDQQKEIGEFQAWVMKSS